MTSTSHSDAWLEAADGTIVPLHGNCAFGRSLKSTVVLKGDKVSRNHATIHAQEGEFWVIDLGSTNGTFLNDLRVSRPTRLLDGARLKIGDSEWVYRKAAEPDQTATAGEAEAVTMMDVRKIPCWLLLADIEGFTPLSQRLDAEELAVVVGQWVKTGRELIEQHGGSVNKYLGDGYLAVWRDSTEAPQQIAAACASLKQFQSGADPAFRVVLHHGNVAVGGSSLLGEENLMGAEVNFVFRLEKLAGALKVPFALSENASRLLAPWVPATLVEGSHALKGFEQLHRLYSV